MTHKAFAVGDRVVILDGDVQVTELLPLVTRPKVENET
jgi:hypothetical protein